MSDKLTHSDTTDDRTPRGKSSHARADELLLAALLAGHSINEAAAAAGIDRRTVCRRLADPTFRQELDQHRAALLRECVGQLTERLGKATAKIDTLIDDPDAKVALAAAKATIELSYRGRREVELEERVDALERRLTSR